MLCVSLVPGVLLVFLVIPGAPPALEPSSAAEGAGSSTTSGGEVLQLWRTGEKRDLRLRGGGPRIGLRSEGKGGFEVNDAPLVVLTEGKLMVARIESFCIRHQHQTTSDASGFCRTRPSFLLVGPYELV